MFQSIFVSHPHWMRLRLGASILFAMRGNRGGIHRGGRYGGSKGRGGGRRGRSNNNHRRNQHTTGPDTTLIEEIGTKIPGETIAIAVEGCCHGKLDDIYARLEELSIDLLICCGDFQSLRSTADYHSFAVPPKYHELGSFHSYYTGAKVAPILTVFVGGNHEASQPLQELYYGGWVAPNIYYLGASGVITYRGVRIGGLSGIYKPYDYQQSRFELPPFDRSTMRSIYHYRNIETYRLKCLSKSRLDVMVSHDWPQGIEQHGDTEGLLRRKPFFREEVEKNALGSPPAMEILRALKPVYWFAAHLHVKFTARVVHDDAAEAQDNTTDVASLVPAQTIVAASPKSINTEFVAPESTSCDQRPDLTDLMTHFLSLDKCLPRRHYLSIVHVPAKSSETSLQYDPEWLVILKETHELSRSQRKQRVTVPGTLLKVTDEQISEIFERFGNNLTIPMEHLEPTVPIETKTRYPPLPRMGHPQTDAFLERMGLPHIANLTIPYSPLFPAKKVDDDNEIALDSSEGEDDGDDGTLAASLPEAKKPKTEVFPTEAT